jgi:hypothetical protein
MPLTKKETPESEPDPTSPAIDPDVPCSVSNGDLPAENMEVRTIKCRVLQMHAGFDVNGDPGNPGEFMVCIGDHWYIAKDL